MDIKELTSLTVKQYKDNGGYVDSSNEEFYRTVHHSLTVMYKRFMSIAKKQMEIDAKAGVIIDEKRMKKEYEDVEVVVIEYASQLASVEKMDI